MNYSYMRYTLVQYNINNFRIYFTDSIHATFTNCLYNLHLDPLIKYILTTTVAAPGICQGTCHGEKQQRYN